LEEKPFVVKRKALNGFDARIVKRTTDYVPYNARRKTKRASTPFNVKRFDLLSALNLTILAPLTKSKQL